MNKRWTKDEELLLVKEVSKGESFAEIAVSHDRSQSAVELKLKKIIFNNVLGGKHINQISSKLKIPLETTKQYFYSYKEFYEKKKGSIAIDDKLLLDENKIEHREKQIGGHKIERKVEQLETKNKIMKLVLENRSLSKQINKLIKEGKMSSDIKDFIKKLNKE